MLAELRVKVAEAGSQIEALSRAVRLEDLVRRRGEIEGRMGAADFWNDQERARQVVQELKQVKALADPLEAARKEARDLAELLEMAEDGDRATVEELAREVQGLEQRLHGVSLQAMLKGQHDHRDAYLSVQPGEGGTDSCDWAEMLLRMYSRWIERRGWGAEVVDRQPAEEAGIKNATLVVHGPYAFGHLRAEAGVHRLVRISPFDAQKRRHTAFAAVDVTPVLDEDVPVEVNEADLRIDTYRSSGAGGQHVNKTESAVRITHLPSGIVVACQNERSQHANRRTAMMMLKARLVRREEEKRAAEQARLYGEKAEISFGSQIRSYVLQPYTQVKDRRTDVATADVQRVLDGDIDDFIEAYLRWKIGQTA